MTVADDCPAMTVSVAFIASDYIRFEWRMSSIAVAYTASLCYNYN